MKTVRCDLHVHTGSSGGRPVKVTAGRRLTVEAAVREARERKGIEVLGLADAAASPVFDELGQMVADRRLMPVAGGGYQAAVDDDRPPLLLLPCSEMELWLAGAPVHVLALLPDLPAVARLRDFTIPRISNPALGCQRVHGTGLAEAAAAVRNAGGLFGLAHAFTPHRGFYGSTGVTISALTGSPVAGVVDFVEMGLSADTELADLVPELAGIPLVAFSDAHSIGTIGREQTELLVDEDMLGFSEVADAIAGRNGRAIAATYGLDPRLGKYHRDACRVCGWVARTADNEVRLAAPAATEPAVCPACGSRSGFVPGVYERIIALAAPEAGRGALRPPYRRVIPLRSLPGIGPRAYERLVRHCGSELAVMLDCPPGELASLVGPVLAGRIVAARDGRLRISPGGGGKYGKVGEQHASDRYSL